MALGDLAMGLAQGFDLIGQHRAQMKGLTQAAGLFNDIGTPAAQQYASLLTSDPSSAADFAGTFGGPTNLYTAMRQDALMRVASQAATSKADLATRQLGVAQQTADARTLTAKTSAETAGKRLTIEQQKADAATTRANNAGQPKPLTASGVAEVEGRISSQYTNLALTKGFQNSIDAWRTIEANAGEQNGPGDIAIMTAFARLENPNAIARQAQIAALQGAGGVPGGVAETFKKLEGGGVLAPFVRDQMIARAKASFTKRLAAQSALETNYRGRASSNNVNPDNAVPDLLGEYRGMLGGSAPAAPAGSATTGPPPGATHRGQDAQGNWHWADANGNDLGLVQQ
jgi:hypothetical protein